jgi:predicted ArsR family transcriptional regulator
VPESETVVVYRILGVLEKARDLNQTPVLDEIADTLHLGKHQVEHYMAMLQQAGAVRAEATPQLPPSYSLTRYGHERFTGGSARS